MQQVAIITGGNAGLGFECAKRALIAGYKVVLACRSELKGANAREELLTLFPGAKISVEQLDLSDLDSALAFAEKFDNNWELLINNAGAKIESPKKLTAQGHEWHIGVNHLGHFALTGALMPKANLNASVVTVSSIVARNGRLIISPIESFNERQAYADSKLMNYVFARELAKRFEGTGRKSIAAHPGFARASAYGNSIIRASEYAFAHSAKAGSDSIWAATDASNGDYLGPKYFELWGKAGQAKKPVVEDSAVKAFWKQSEELTGVRFV